MYWLFINLQRIDRIIDTVAKSSVLTNVGNGPGLNFTTIFIYLLIDYYEIVKTSKRDVFLEYLNIFSALYTSTHCILGSSL